MYELNHSDIISWAEKELARKDFKPYHAILCDPPYGIDFMNKEWDGYGTNLGYQTTVTSWGKALLPLMYPGAIVMMFGGTRMSHRLAAGMEDAGFEVWDQICWIYGSGFPKGHSIKVGGWDGYKTAALKPAYEPCIMFRVPRKKSSAYNAEHYGSGALNIDGCAIGNEVIEKRGGGYTDKNKAPASTTNWVTPRKTFTGGRYPANIMFECICEKTEEGKATKGDHYINQKTSPFNDVGIKNKSLKISGSQKETTTIHTNPNCPCYQLDQQSGKGSAGHFPKLRQHGFTPDIQATNERIPNPHGEKWLNETGGASRFFYCAKTGRKERNAGCKGGVKEVDTQNDIGKGSYTEKGIAPSINNHPTLKPIKLTTYLAKLVLPPECVGERRILVPFAGTGSEMVGALKAGWDTVIGVEQDKDYVAIGNQRLEFWTKDESGYDKFFC